VASRLQKISLFLGRIVAGLYFVNFGLAALWTSHWSPAGFVTGAHTFAGFYHTVAASSLLAVVAPVIEFGCIVLGACLILGLFARIAAVVGMAFALFLYFPTLAFPYVCVAGVCTSFIVNEYLLVAGLLFMLVAFGAGEVFSISRLFRFSQY